MKDYKLKLGSYAPRINWVGRGTGTLKDSTALCAIAFTDV
jgi:hypothetical protein